MLSIQFLYFYYLILPILLSLGRQSFLAVGRAAGALRMPVHMAFIQFLAACFTLGGGGVVLVETPRIESAARIRIGDSAASRVAAREECYTGRR